MKALCGGVFDGTYPYKYGRDTGCENRIYRRVAEAGWKAAALLTPSVNQSLKWGDSHNGRTSPVADAQEPRPETVGCPGVSTGAF